MKNPAASRRVSISIYQPLLLRPCGKPQGIAQIKADTHQKIDAS
ncbi:hypothetical protein C5S32_12320 [ANME-1 cluster archaeon GoMg1]|nr:hypothetical protein [ANME-1 cluster archaeon GoMg1]